MSGEVGTETAKGRVPNIHPLSLSALWAALRRAHPADIGMVVAVLASGVLLLRWLGRITFSTDEWLPLLHRTGWGPSEFLDPWVEHLVALPILISKVLLAVFGMDSPLPYQVVAVAFFLASLVLLFVYVRSRSGPWLAFALVLPILFFGPAWDDLLAPFHMAFTGSMLCGVGALLALDRGDRTGDIVASGLLLLGLLYSDVGVPFVAGATVEIALDRERVRRAFVVVIPTAAWGLWYLGWGHEAQTFISDENVAHLLSNVLTGLAASLASLLGLATPEGQFQSSALDWGRPLLVAAVVLAGWRIYRLGGAPARLLAVLAIALGFWSLIGLNASPITLPTAGRYQYMGAMMLVLIAAELTNGLRPRGAAVAVALVISVAAALSNAFYLRDTARALEVIAVHTRAGLAALEFSRDTVDPDFTLTREDSGADYLGLVSGRSYFPVVDEHGSPAYTAEELATAPDVARLAADKVFGEALEIELVPAPPGTPGRCVEVNPAAGEVVRQVPPQGLILDAGAGRTDVAVQRYSSGPAPVYLGRLHGGDRVLLEIPPDRAPLPWTVGLTGTAKVSVCERAGT